MEIVLDPNECQKKCLQERCLGKVTALVPTMGYYHAGHLSLMQKAKSQADKVIVSLFVNPAQFGPGEDYDSYPRDFDRDAGLAEAEGVDILFAPKVEDMYDPDWSTSVSVDRLSQGLCARSRPNHFQGVCTVVSKLFNLTIPKIAFFGQKDWQQLAIIRRMVRDLNFPVQIFGCPIVREDDGLAMSSRNKYLDGQQRREAAWIYAGLRQASQWFSQGLRDGPLICSYLKNYYSEHITSGQIDYIEVVDLEDLVPLDHIEQGTALLAVAVFLGRARLIDNILLEGDE